MSDNSAEAGWYPDPHNAAQQRYYDGTQWTDHYAPIAGTAPAEAWDTRRDLGDTAPTGLSSIGSLLGAAWNVLIKRIGSFIGLTVGLILAGVVIAVVFLLGFIGAAGANSDGDLGATFGIALLLYIVALLIFLAIYAAYVLTISRISLAEHQGVSLTIGQAWNQVKRRVLPFAGLLILLYIGFALVFGILAAILALIAEPLLLLLLPAFLFAMVKIAFLPSAAAADTDAGMVQGALAVSAGRFWPILGRLICLGLVAIVWAIVSQLLLLAVSDSGALVAIVFVITFVGNLLAGLFLVVGTTKLYLETGGRSSISMSQA